mmetsp:Transcript_12172/g.34489  ORF Transcript_12172/g.34489 Transcript_12172/m.34489 type:complete len:339 (-) Transcript_12172:581-1597(-)
MAPRTASPPPCAPSCALISRIGIPTRRTYSSTSCRCATATTCCSENHSCARRRRFSRTRPIPWLSNAVTAGLHYIQPWHVRSSPQKRSRSSWERSRPDTWASHACRSSPRTTAPTVPSSPTPTNSTAPSISFRDRLQTQISLAESLHSRIQVLCWPSQTQHQPPQRTPRPWPTSPPPTPPSCGVSNNNTQEFSMGPHAPPGAPARSPTASSCSRTPSQSRPLPGGCRPPCCANCKSNWIPCSKTTSSSRREGRGRRQSCSSARRMARTVSVSTTGPSTPKPSRTDTPYHGWRTVSINYSELATSQPWTYNQGTIKYQWQRTASSSHSSYAVEAPSSST